MNNKIGANINLAIKALFAVSLYLGFIEGQMFFANLATFLICFMALVSAISIFLAGDMVTRITESGRFFPEWFYLAYGATCTGFLLLTGQIVLAGIYLFSITVFACLWRSARKA